MIKTFLSLFLITFLTIPTYSQEENEVGINERLTVYFPILEPPHCVNYLTEFGPSKKVVIDYVNSIGVNFFGMIALPQVEGVTASMYAEPENMVSPDGSVLTENILYSFIFDPNEKYFAFSLYIKFETQELADSFQKTLLENLKVKKYTRNYSGIITCKSSGKQRMVTSRVESKTLTYVVMDYQSIINMSLDTSKM